MVTCKPDSKHQTRHVAWQGPDGEEHGERKHAADPRCAGRLVPRVAKNVEAEPARLAVL